MLLRRLIAPTRCVWRRETKRRRHTKQFCPAFQSTAACFELPTSWEESKPGENASSCDPDKALTMRQVNVRQVRTVVSENFMPWRVAITNHSRSIKKWADSEFAWQRQRTAVHWPRCAIDSALK